MVGVLIIVLAIAEWYWTVHAQTTTARCNNLDYEWSHNYLHQSPCLVAAYLQNTCSPGFNVPSLDSIGSPFYRAPQQASKCGCSSVVYTLMAACGGCQQKAWTSWEDWSSSCGGFDIPMTKYTVEIPGGTVVPGWAYQNPELHGGSFDPDMVQYGDEYFNRAPEIPIKHSANTSTTPSSSTTLSGSQFPTSDTTISNRLLSTNNTSRTYTSDSGAIVDGTVSGVGSLAFLCGLLACRCCSRRKGDRSASHPVTEAQPGRTTGQAHGDPGGSSSGGFLREGINMVARNTAQDLAKELAQDITKDAPGIAKAVVEDFEDKDARDRIEDDVEDAARDAERDVEGWF